MDNPQNLQTYSDSKNSNTKKYLMLLLVLLLAILCMLTVYIILKPKSSTNVNNGSNQQLTVTLPYFSNVSLELSEPGWKFATFSPIYNEISSDSTGTYLDVSYLANDGSTKSAKVLVQGDAYGNSIEGLIYLNNDETKLLSVEDIKNILVPNTQIALLYLIEAPQNRQRFCDKNTPLCTLSKVLDVEKDSVQNIYNNNQIPDNYILKPAYLITDFTQQDDE